MGLTISCLLVYAAAHPVTLIAGMEAESAALCMQMIAAITIVKPVAGCFHLYLHTDCVPQEMSAFQ